MGTTSHATGSAVSADGTTIGYRQLGRGPGIVVVHGSRSAGYYHLPLAEALADVFTLYLLDRRGRWHGPGSRPTIERPRTPSAPPRHHCGISATSL